MSVKENTPQFDHDDCSTLDGNENSAFLNEHYMKEAKSRKHMLYLTFVNLFLFMISALTLICAVFSQHSDSTHSTAKLMDQFGVFSPAMHVVDYKHTKFQLPNPIQSSRFVGISNDTTNAWKEITDLPDQMIRKEDFPKLQKSPDSLTVTDPKTGETGYRVGLEVFHHLQCLNMLREATYPSFHSRTTNESPEEMRVHLDHCVEILRINLMCMPDITVFTFDAKPGLKGSWPDYESHNQVCRNFDDIRRWALDNGMPALDA